MKIASDQDGSAFIYCGRYENRSDDHRNATAGKIISDALRLIKVPRMGQLHDLATQYLLRLIKNVQM
jgi:hypothetical protein